MAATQEEHETVEVEVPHARIIRPTLDACITHEGEGRPVDRIALLTLLSMHANKQGIVAYSIRGWATELLGMSGKRFQRALRDLLRVKAVVPLDERGCWRIRTYVYANARRTREEGGGYVHIPEQWAFITLPNIVEAACSSRSRRIRQTATRNIAVWVALMMLRENGTAHAKIATLAEDLGVGRDAIIGALDELEAAGLIEAEATHYTVPTASGALQARRGANVYTPTLVLTQVQADARGYGWATDRDYTTLETRLSMTPKSADQPKSDGTENPNPTLQKAENPQRSRFDVSTSETSKRNTCPTKVGLKGFQDGNDGLEVQDQAQEHPATEEDDNTGPHHSVAGQELELQEGQDRNNPTEATRGSTSRDASREPNARMESAKVEFRGELSFCHTFADEALDTDATPAQHDAAVGRWSRELASTVATIQIHHGGPWANEDALAALLRQQLGEGRDPHTLINEWVRIGVQAVLPAGPMKKAA